MIKLASIVKGFVITKKTKYDPVDFYYNYYKNLAPSTHDISVEDGKIVISGIFNNIAEKKK